MEIGILAQEMPSMDEIFACITPRITNMEPLPRISCFMGGKEEAQTELPKEIECLIPRLSCLMELYG